MGSKEKGAYLPSTQVWDVSEIYQQQDIGTGLKELLVRMYQNLNNMATMVNNKETALYPLDEFVCGKKYFSNPTLTSASGQTPKLRQVFRKVVNFGTLPNAATKTVAHEINIDANTILTGCTGVSTDPVGLVLIPLPYIAPLNDNIALWIDNTNVNIKTFATDRTNFTITLIVIEYLKF